MEVKKSKKANLQNKRLLFVEIGLVLALLLVLGAFEWSTREKSVSMLEDDRVAVIEDEMLALEQEDQPTPPPAPPAPVMTDEFFVVEDNVKINDNVIINMDDIKDPVKIIDYVEARREEEAVEEEIPFAIVEEKPSFMGGDANDFSKWIAKNLVYPDAARENGVQGRVYVEFVVTAQGNVTNVKVKKGVDPEIDKEAVRVISSSPKWSPGKQRGKPVRVVYNIPVTFQLR